MAIAGIVFPNALSVIQIVHLGNCVPGVVVLCHPVVHLKIIFHLINYEVLL